MRGHGARGGDSEDVTAGAGESQHGSFHLICECNLSVIFLLGELGQAMLPMIIINITSWNLFGRRGKI